jgi:hypothetical protein
MKPPITNEPIEVADYLMRDAVRRNESIVVLELFAQKLLQWAAEEGQFPNQPVIRFVDYSQKDIEIAEG